MTIFKDGFDKPVEFFSKIWEERTGQIPNTETSIKFKENFLESLNITRFGKTEMLTVEEFQTLNKVEEAQISIAMAMTDPSTIAHMDKNLLSDNPEIIDAAIHTEEKAIELYIPKENQKYIKDSYNYARGIMQEWQLPPIKTETKAADVKLPPCSRQYWPELENG